MIGACTRALVAVAAIMLAGSAVAVADPIHTPSPPVQCSFLPSQIDALNARAKAETNPTLAAQLRYQAKGLTNEENALHC